MNKAEAVVSLSLLFAGYGLLVAGVFVLAGLGWTLVMSSVPPMAVGVILVRGIVRRASSELT